MCSKLYYNDWKTWQDTNDLQHLYIHKLQSLFPYLNTYFFPPFKLTNRCTNSVVVTNAINNIMLIQWTTQTSQTSQTNDECGHKLETNRQGVNISQYLHVYNKHIWLLASENEDVNNVTNKQLDGEANRQLDGEVSKQLSKEIIIYSCCEYTTYSKEFVTYINPFTTLSSIGVKMQYRIICECDSINVINGMMDMPKINVNNNNNSNIIIKTLQQCVSDCCDLQSMIRFEVADFESGIMYIFNGQNLISITCWESGKNNGVYRHTIINGDGEIQKPKSDLALAIYNSIHTSDLNQPDLDLYFISTSDSIFHLFDNLLVDNILTNGNVVNPKFTHYHTHNLLSKRKLKTTVTVDPYISQLKRQTVSH